MRTIAGSLSAEPDLLLGTLLRQSKSVAGNATAGLTVNHGLMIDARSWRRSSMNGKERNEHETLCPRCGAEAEWLFLDPEKRLIEVMCPDCGLLEMTREEFDSAVVENAEVNEPEQR
jgi:hypothetical protein